MVDVNETPLPLDTSTSFASLTTLRLGGQPRGVIRCTSEQEIVSTVRSLDDAHVSLLVVGGGSNLVVADGELDVVAVVLLNDELSVTESGLVTVGAGAVWDDVVVATIEAGLRGIECLSGIPGSAGATPVQNVGAYGAEISDVLTRVKLYDRNTQEVSWVPASSLELAYRYSNLKFTSRAVVLAVEMQLEPATVSRPLRFLDGAQLPLARTRDEVLALRRSKGMVLDPDDHDTWSAGSFFTNPVVPVEVAAGIDGGPKWPVDGGVKLSAAWLIENAGFPRGYPGSEAPARLSTKHTLALTNRGHATSAELAALAREVRAGVQREFGITLVPEPVWVGMSIDD